jgi:hypothetical protein
MSTEDADKEKGDTFQPKNFSRLQPQHDYTCRP